MKQKQQTALPLLIGIILLGALLRFHDINRVPLRGDEAFTLLHWIREPLSQTFANIATVDPQPPLAYVLFHLWGALVGTGEYTVRFLPALLNILGTPILYALGKRVGGTRVGLAAALLWAVHPYQIWHAQDARNYAIWAVLSPLALWLALRAVERGRHIDWVLYIIAALVAAYTYYLELFSIALITLYVMLTYRRDRVVLIRWGTALVVIAVALAPWFLQSRLLFGSGYGGTAGRFEPSLLITWFVPSLVFGEVITFPIVVAVILLLLFGIALWRMWQDSGRQWLLFLFLGTVPLLLIGIVSLKLNVFVPRYVLMVSAVYVMLTAYVIGVRSTRWVWRVLSVVTLVVVLGVNQIVLARYFLTDYAKSPNWRDLTTYLASVVDPLSQVIQTAADEAYTLYDYENRVPSDPLRLPANPRQSAEEIENELARYAETASSLWVIAQPPNWENRAVVDTWLDANMQRVRDTLAGGLRAAEYMRWDVDPTEIGSTIARFGEIAELVGYRVLLPEPTGELPVWLYWQPLSTSETPLTVFVHLTGEINPVTGTPLWSQDDHEPQYGRARTTLWSVGTVYRDVFEIPLEQVPPGQYQLVIGWYDPAAGVRVPVGSGDSYTLEVVTLP